LAVTHLLGHILTTSSNSYSLSTNFSSNRHCYKLQFLHLFYHFLNTTTTHDEYILTVQGKSWLLKVNVGRTLTLYEYRPLSTLLWSHTVWTWKSKVSELRALSRLSTPIHLRPSCRARPMKRFCVCLVCKNQMTCPTLCLSLARILMAMLGSRSAWSFLVWFPNQYARRRPFPKPLATFCESQANSFLLVQITVFSCSIVPAPGTVQRATPTKLQTFPHPPSIICAESTTSVDAAPRVSTNPRATLALALTPSLRTVQT
jgi:hypothetical protein